jgi:hypothetical protein
MKGQLEDAVKGLGFSKLSIFNPPILERKNTDRSGEVIGLKVIRFLQQDRTFRFSKTNADGDTRESLDKFRPSKRERRTHLQSRRHLEVR